MEERVEISMLLDLYGDLLTDKQKELMMLYYNEDLSLAEISEITNTSRQAIHDILKRCHKILMQYEDKLHLLSKSFEAEEINNEIAGYLNLIREKNIDVEVEEIIKKIEDKLSRNL